jgi:uncharacterized protein
MAQDELQRLQPSRLAAEPAATSGRRCLLRSAPSRGDWVANGVLFAAYHLHMPWVIPANLVDMFVVSYPAKRYRSTWIGIAVHSAQSVVFAIIVFTYVV